MWPSYHPHRSLTATARIGSQTAVEIIPTAVRHHVASVTATATVIKSTLSLISCVCAINLFGMHVFKCFVEVFGFVCWDLE